MPQIEELTAKLRLDVSEFNSGMSAVSREMQTTGQSINTFGRQVAVSAAAMAALSAATLVGKKGFEALTGGAVAAAPSIAKVAAASTAGASSLGAMGASAGAVGGAMARLAPAALGLAVPIVGLGIAAIGTMKALGRLDEAVAVGAQEMMAREAATFRLRALFDDTTEAASRLHNSLLAVSRAPFFDQSQIAASQAILANSGATAKQIETFIPVLADMAAVMGTDLVGASDRLAMALIGSTRGLKDFGIYIQAGSSQTEILAAVQAKAAQFHGMAAEKVATLEGKMRAYNKTMLDASTHIASVFSPLLVINADLMLGLANAANQLAGALDRAFKERPLLNLPQWKVGPQAGGARMLNIPQSNPYEAAIAGGIVPKLSGPLAGFENLRVGPDGTLSGAPAPKPAPKPTPAPKGAPAGITLPQGDAGVGAALGIFEAMQRAGEIAKKSFQTAYEAKAQVARETFEAENALSREIHDIDMEDLDESREAHKREIAERVAGEERILEIRLEAAKALSGLAAKGIRGDGISGGDLIRTGGGFGRIAATAVGGPVAGAAVDIGTELLGAIFDRNDSIAQAQEQAAAALRDAAQTQNDAAKAQEQAAAKANDAAAMARTAATLQQQVAMQDILKSRGGIAAEIAKAQIDVDVARGAMSKVEAAKRKIDIATTERQEAEVTKADVTPAEVTAAKAKSVQNLAPTSEQTQTISRASTETSGERGQRAFQDVFQKTGNIALAQAAMASALAGGPDVGRNVQADIPRSLPSLANITSVKPITQMTPEQVRAGLEGAGPNVEFREPEVAAALELPSPVTQKSVAPGAVAAIETAAEGAAAAPGRALERAGAVVSNQKSLDVLATLLKQLVDLQDEASKTPQPVEVVAVRGNIAVLDANALMRQRTGGASRALNPGGNARGV